jgi:tetratricopeptide (TPR) repeat protein
MTRTFVTRTAVWALAVALAGPAAAQPARVLPPGAEAWSLFGEPLTPPAPSAETRAKQEADLEAARAAFEANPQSADALIWLGRRVAYLGRYREAIETFSRGVSLHPDDARFYRHRGHRYLTIRRFDRAIADLEKAASLVAGQPDEVEPDGQPNSRNVPTSTLQSNIHYHRALAYYVTGNFEKARSAYDSCLKVSKNPDMQVATTYWQNMTLRRLGKTAEADALVAGISKDMDIIENQSYHQMLLLWQGKTDADALVGGAGAALDKATLGYGIGAWHLINGRKDRAVAAWRAVSGGTQWASFGGIAAEADLHRMGERPRP